MIKFFEKIKQAFRGNDYEVDVKSDKVEFNSAKGKFKFNGDIEAENIGGNVEEIVVDDLYVSNRGTFTKGISTHGDITVYDDKLTLVDSAADGGVQIEFIAVGGSPVAKFILRPNFSAGTLELSVDAGATWKTVQTA